MKTREFTPKGLRLTDEQFQKLHEQVAATRSTSKTVKLDKESTQNLLADYSLLLGHIDDLEAVLRHPSPDARVVKQLDARKGADLI